MFFGNPNTCLIANLLASTAGSQQYHLGQVVIHAPQLLSQFRTALYGFLHVHTYLQRRLTAPRRGVRHSTIPPHLGGLAGFCRKVDGDKSVQITIAYVSEALPGREKSQRLRR